MRIGRTIYLDHQSTTPVSAAVLKDMHQYLVDKFGNPHSSEHAIGWESGRAVEVAAEQIARLVGADDDEVIFTSGATEANNLGLLGYVRKAARSGRRRILVSQAEHKCVLAIGRRLTEELGVDVELLPVDNQGFVDIPQLQHLIDDDVLLVSVMAVNNEIGAIQNICDISDICDSRGVIYHCDAAQAPCAIDMRSLASRPSLISLSAHKMYGPKGIGALIARRDLHSQIEPLIYGGGQQNGLRSGTLPTPLCVGMGRAAAELMGDDVPSRREELAKRRDKFVEKLQNVAGPIRYIGPAKSRDRHPGNASIAFEGLDAQDILLSLQPHLAASTGSACTSGIPEASHVLKAIGLDEETARSTIRFSFGFDTTDEDIEEAVSLITRTLSRVREAILQCA